MFKQLLSILPFVTILPLALLAKDEEAKPAGPFAQQTIDLGVVVSDLEKSIAFYKDVVGFKEVEGFKVAGDFSKKVGLTDGAALDIHVLVLGEDETATKLKVMQVKSEKPAPVIKQRHIHTTAGFSYVSIFVTDVDAVLERAKKAGIKPYAQSPQRLAEGLPQDVRLLMLKDPDGNFVEIIGPLTKTRQQV
ncbi:MAG: VOC family protein, partial [Verrucomicrobia bacterium]|nr:VOC family protein [Verrucomicrobiota bacterium]